MGRFARLWLTGLAALAAGCGPAEPAATAYRRTEGVAPPTEREPEALEPGADAAPQAAPVPPAASAAARPPTQGETAQAFPLFGVATQHISQVYPRPDTSAAPIGYMRRGSTFRAAPAAPGVGCRRWHPVPGGGFVCAAQGFVVDEAPPTPGPGPAAPTLNADLPYRYGYTQRDGVPQYWELPDPGREGEAEALIAERTARAADGGVEAPTDEVVDHADGVVAPPPPGRGAPEPSEPDGAPWPDWLRTPMLRGFYVSLDREEEAPGGRPFWRTARNAFVRSDALRLNEPPSSRGVTLGGAWRLPLAIAHKKGATRYARNPLTSKLVRDGTLERHTPLVIAERLLVEGREYFLGDDGTIVRDLAVRVLEPVRRPPGIPRGARWIHVKLATQALVAYDGDAPVYATLVSSGKEGFETPTGIYRIQSKHVSTTMDDPESPEGAYSIEDVPWTMYFHGSFALHGAFWHYTFGNVRSHGCVNLSPADARWLFEWAGPELPAGWHGVFADPRTNPGAWVFIEP